MECRAPLLGSVKARDVVLTVASLTKHEYHRASAVKIVELSILESHNAV